MRKKKITFPLLFAVKTFLVILLLFNLNDDNGNNDENDDNDVDDDDCNDDRYDYIIPFPWNKASIEVIRFAIPTLKLT